MPYNLVSMYKIHCWPSLYDRSWSNENIQIFKLSFFLFLNQICPCLFCGSTSSTPVDSMLIADMNVIVLINLLVLFCISFHWNTTLTLSQHFDLALWDHYVLCTWCLGVSLESILFNGVQDQARSCPMSMCPTESSAWRFHKTEMTEEIPPPSVCVDAKIWFLGQECSLRGLSLFSGVEWGKFSPSPPLPPTQWTTTPGGARRSPWQVASRGKRVG